MGTQIEWPDADDYLSTIAIVKDRVTDHDKAIHGNGKEGLMDFMAGLKAQMRLLIFLVSLTGILSGVALVIVTLKVAH